MLSSTRIPPALATLEAGDTAIPIYYDRCRASLKLRERSHTRTSYYAQGMPQDFMAR